MATNGTSKCHQMQLGQLPIETRNFINGEFREPTGEFVWENINPSTGEVINKLRDASKNDVNEAVEAADKAFVGWSGIGGRNRGKVMFKLAELMEKHADQLAEIECMDAGKPLAVCRQADLALSVDTIRYYAGLADKIEGSVHNIQHLPTNEFHAYSRREPVGVCGQIIPFNFPLLMMAWKIGPALAAGCTIVLKPSEKTTLSALSFAHLFNEAGLPAGVLNLVTGHGPTVGHEIVVHPKIRKIAFTGSTISGKNIAANAATYGHKNVTLELGGKSPLIIFDDCDLQKAVETAHFGLFFNMGECCIASTRIFVHENIYEKFIAMMSDKVKQTKAMDPMNKDCFCGPIVDKKQYERVLHYIEMGKREGAKLVVGGNAVQNTKGYFVEPTLFVDVQDHMQFARDEIFGPVMSIFKFKDVDEVVKRANDTEYGLGAGVLTQNVAITHRVANKLHAGTVYVNCYNVFDVAVPFGGYKTSGIGRELGINGVNPYLESKAVIVNLGKK